MEWISVKERLPELIQNTNGAASEMVLVHCPSEERKRWYPDDIVIRAYHSNGGWCYDYGEYMRPDDIEALTHWMPLPDPPKT